MKYDVPETARWIVTSPPSRGAWIEIRISAMPNAGTQVAPLAGGVD